MIKKLTDVCDIQYGYAFNSAGFTSDAAYIPLIRIRDVKRGYSETYFSMDYPKEYIVHNSDLLISMDGEFNIARWKGQDALLNQRVCKVTAKQDVNEEYLRFALTRILKRLEDKTSFVTVKHLSARELNKLELVIPAIEEQNRTALLLSTLEALQSLKHEELSKLDELVNARFVEMFGDLALNPKNWTQVSLREVCKEPDDIKCGPFGTQLGKDEYLSDGIPVWGIPQINKNFQIPTYDFVSYEKATELSKFSLLPGDIAMSRKGNVGKCAIYPIGYPDGIIHSDVLRIRVDRNICNPIFLMYQLHFSRAVETQINLVSHGAIMAGINVSKLKNIQIHIPSITLQNDFETFVQKADKSKFAISKYL